MSIGDAADTVSDVLSDSMAALTPSLPSSQAVRASRQSRSPSTDVPDDDADGSLGSGRTDLASARDMTRIMSTVPNWQSAGSTLSLHSAISTELSQTRDRYSRDNPWSTCSPNFEPQFDTSMLRTCIDPALYTTQSISKTLLLFTQITQNSLSQRSDATELWKLKLVGV